MWPRQLDERLTQQTKTKMNAILPTLFVSLIALAGASAILLACTRRRDPIDDLAGVSSDIEDAPQPQLTASVCASCKAVKCVDRRWMPARLVRLPHGCQISHGACPDCHRRQMAEAEVAFAKLEGKAV